MKEKKKIKEYYKNNELDLETIIDEYSGYVYKIIENMAIQKNKGGKNEFNRK